MKLYESLYILQRFCETIESLTALMIKNNYHRKTEWGNQDRIHYITLYQNVLLDVHSYLDEYDNYFLPKSEPEFRERILTVKKIAKPAVDQIKKWKELGAVRNEMIAHNWREKGTGNIIVPKIGTYDSPRNFHDLLYVQTYITLIQTVISAEFHVETPDVMPYIRSLGSASEAPITNPEYEQEIRSLVKAVNEKCIESGRDYRIDEEKVFLLKSGE